MKATVPELNEDGIIEFRKARHPLIQKDKVVPVDIRLGMALIRWSSPGQIPAVRPWR